MSGLCIILNSQYFWFSLKYCFLGFYFSILFANCICLPDCWVLHFFFLGLFWHIFFSSFYTLMQQLCRTKNTFFTLRQCIFAHSKNIWKYKTVGRILVEIPCIYQNDSLQYWVNFCIIQLLSSNISNFL